MEHSYTSSIRREAPVKKYHQQTDESTHYVLTLHDRAHACTPTIALAYAHNHTPTRGYITLHAGRHVYRCFPGFRRPKFLNDRHKKYADILNSLYCSHSQSHFSLHADDDECSRTPSGCVPDSSGGQCVNTPGSFVCGCQTGYQLTASGDGCDGMYITAHTVREINY